MWVAFYPAILYQSPGQIRPSMVLGYQTQETIMRQSVELAIRVAGKPLHQYKDHEDDIFVEGRKGSEYTLHIHNRYSLRVLAVLSVDGLSIMDGKLATPESRGYILGPYASMEIPGWSLNEEAVAKFKFGDKEKSYAALGETQDTSNSGTIGMLVYSEKTKQVPLTGVALLGYRDVDTHGNPRGLYWSKGPQSDNHYEPSHGTLRMVGSNSNSQTAQAQAIGSTALDMGYSSLVIGCSLPLAPATANNLGTEFGSESAFKTVSKSFERDYQIQASTIYYDDARGLKLRGISVIKNPQTPAPKGNPFPGTSCKPPASWSGKQ